MTHGNNQEISQDPAEMPPLPGSLPWFLHSVSTRLSQPLEPLLTLLLSSSVLEITVDVSATPIQCQLPDQACV